MAKYSVLIADGDPDYIQYLGGTLKANGFDSAGTSSGTNALEIYKRDSPDLVIADFDIAGLNGLELLQQLRGFDSKAKLVLTTDTASKELVTSAFRMGALDVLEKPLDVEFLTNKIHELLSREDRALEGDLRMMSLASIIQINCEERNQAQLILNYQGREGIIFFKDGEMIHAETGDLTGEEAVFALLGWEQGAFQLKMDAEPSLRTIEKSWSGVLLEGMRRIDESTAGWSPDWEDDFEISGVPTEDDLPQRILKAIGSVREVNGALICTLEGKILAQDMPGNADEYRNWGLFFQDKGEMIAGFLDAGSLEQIVLSGSEERFYLQRRKEHLVLLSLSSRASAESTFESVEMIYKRYQ